MGKSAKITRGGNKKRVNTGRLVAKEAAYLTKKTAMRQPHTKQTALPTSTQTRIQANQTKPVGSALLSSEQAIKNTIKRLSKLNK